MNKILFLFLSFFALQNTVAQSTLISGKVVIDDIDYHVDLDNFSIINLNTNAKTTANSDGIFSIKVNLNDELLFKNEGIEERVLKISENIISKGFVTIHLNVEIIELAEATINPLKKNLKDNINKEKTFSAKLNDEMGISSPEYKAKLNFKREEEMVNRTIKAVGGVSLMGLVGLITGSHKKIKNVKVEPQTKHDQLINLKNLYTTYYFVNDLKIPEGKIIEFLDYCYTNFNFKELLQVNNFEEILFILGEQAPIYLSKITSNE